MSVISRHSRDGSIILEVTGVDPAKALTTHLIPAHLFNRNPVFFHNDSFKHTWYLFSSNSLLETFTVSLLYKFIIYYKLFMKAVVLVGLFCASESELLLRPKTTLEIRSNNKYPSLLAVNSVHVAGSWDVHRLICCTRVSSSSKVEDLK